MAITKEELEELYIRQGFNRNKVCDMLGIGKKLFKKLITEYQIIKTSNPELTRELLYKLYIENDMSTKEIVKLLKISRATLFNLFKKYGIKKDPETIEYRKKQTCLKKYGHENPMQNKEIQDKVKQTNLDKYGVTCTLYNKDIREKATQTCIEKYGVDLAIKSQKVQNKIKKAYSTGIPQQKCNDTKRLNNSWNTSKPEEDAYKLILEHFPKDDIIRQYSSNLYPFSCDFYIKSLDLYIEFQGTWCHGGVPFNENNEIHQKLISKWKSKETEYFDYAIKVFTYYDPLKREIAKNNNLNWKEFFSLEELQEWLLQNNYNYIS